MKHGKNPTVGQMVIMEDAGYDPKQWLIVKSLPYKLIIVRRGTEQNPEIAEIILRRG